VGWQGGSGAQLRQEEQVNLSITVIGFLKLYRLPPAADVLMA